MAANDRETTIEEQDPFYQEALDDLRDLRGSEEELVWWPVGQ